MGPLLDAIYLKCSSTSSITTAYPAETDSSTGTTITYPVAYFRDFAPEVTALPYLVSTVITGDRQVFYGGNSITQPTIQFAGYAAGHDASFTKFKAFTDVFDELILTLSSGHQVNVERITDLIPQLDPDKDKDGNDVWQWACTYRFTVSNQ